MDREKTSGSENLAMSLPTNIKYMETVKGQTAEIRRMSYV